MIDISPIQIIMVLVIALLVFGPKALPDMARTAGRGLRELRDGVSMSPSRPRRTAAAPTRPEEHGDDVLAGVVVPGDSAPGGAAEPGDGGPGERPPS